MMYHCSMQETPMLIAVKYRFRCTTLVACSLSLRFLFVACLLMSILIESIRRGGAARAPSHDDERSAP